MNNVKKIIWLSWWPDSMYLEYIIEKQFWKKNILIAHFNHKFRKESDKEEQFLKNYFKKKWIDFVSEVYNWIDFRESTLRRYRYNFFKKLGWWKYNLYLWHNLTDRIETTFLNISRWTWLKWFLNMKKVDKKNKIIRPLLDMSKKEIQDLCDENDIPYFIDKTNFDNKISKRNLIRNEIFPLFEQLWWDFVKNFNTIYQQIETILPNFNIEKYLIKLNDNFYKLILPNKNLDYFVRELFDYFWWYNFRKWVIYEIIDYINKAKWWWFKRYKDLYFIKKHNNIYVWYKLNDLEIWQKIKEL